MNNELDEICTKLKQKNKEELSEALEMHSIGVFLKKENYNPFIEAICQNPDKESAQFYLDFFYEIHPYETTYALLNTQDKFPAAKGYIESHSITTEDTHAEKQFEVFKQDLIRNRKIPIEGWLLEKLSADQLDEIYSNILLLENMEKVRNLKKGEVLRIEKGEASSRTVTLGRDKQGNWYGWLETKTKSAAGFNDMPEEKRRGQFKHGVSSFNLTTRERNFNAIQGLHDASDLYNAISEFLYSEKILGSNNMTLGAIFEKNNRYKLSTYAPLATGDLSQILENYNLSLLEKLEIFSKILQAVWNLNQAGFCHNDLKPENILCFLIENHAMLVQLADFGLSSPYAKPTKGTRWYLPPEILKELLTYTGNRDFKKLVEDYNNLTDQQILEDWTIESSRKISEKITDIESKDGWAVGCIYADIFLAGIKHINIEAIQENPVLRILLNPDKTKRSITYAREIIDDKIEVLSKQIDALFDHVIELNTEEDLIVFIDEYDKLLYGEGKHAFREGLDWTLKNLKNSCSSLPENLDGLNLREVIKEKVLQKFNESSTLKLYPTLFREKLKEYLVNQIEKDLFPEKSSSRTERTISEDSGVEDADISSDIESGYASDRSAVGEELSDPVTKNSPSFTDNLIKALQSCKSIYQMHEKGIIHGNLQERHLKQTKVSGHVEILSLRGYEKTNPNKSDLFALGQIFQHDFHLPAALCKTFLQTKSNNSDLIKSQIKIFIKELEKQPNLTHQQAERVKDMKKFLHQISKPPLPPKPSAEHMRKNFIPAHDQNVIKKSFFNQGQSLEHPKPPPKPKGL